MQRTFAVPTAEESSAIRAHPRVGLRVCRWLSLSLGSEVFGEIVDEDRHLRIRHHRTAGHHDFHGVRPLVLALALGDDQVCVMAHGALLFDNLLTVAGGKAAAFIATGTRRVTAGA